MVGSAGITGDAGKEASAPFFFLVYSDNDERGLRPTEITPLFVPMKSPRGSMSRAGSAKCLIIH